MTGWEGIYCGPPPSPLELAGRWNLDPVALAILVGLALWAGRSRASVTALFVLALIFLSPLCALSSALFSARVLHHVLLVAVAAPLFALARPSRKPASVAPAFLVATATLWLWHAPVAYDAALSDMGVYWLMQASLFGSALWFWTAAFSRPDGAGAGWVLLAFIAMGLLGALLTFAPAPLYAVHVVAPLLWGFEPLVDQQLGGLLMWVPAGIPYAVWGALLARRAWRGMGQSS